MKAQYLAMEDELLEIGRELGMEPLKSLEQIWRLSKVREMEDLQAWIDCLLKENPDLKTQTTNREEKLKEVEALTMAAFEEKVRAQENREKAVTMALKFHAFVGYPGDVVNKASLYDDSMGKLEVAPAPKVIQCLVDYNGKMEKLFKELRALLQLGEQREEARPSKQWSEPVSIPVSEPEVSTQGSSLYLD